MFKNKNIRLKNARFVCFLKKTLLHVRRIHMAYERGERLWMPSIPITPPFSCMLTNTGFLRTGVSRLNGPLLADSLCYFRDSGLLSGGYIVWCRAGRCLLHSAGKCIVLRSQRGNRVYQYSVCRLCPTGRHRYAVRFVERSVPAQFFRYAGNADLLWESLRQRTD